MVLSPWLRSVTILCALKWVAVSAQDLFLAVEPDRSETTVRPAPTLQTIAAAVDDVRESLPSAATPLKPIKYPQLKHVLWPEALPKPSMEYYGSWYNSSNYTFVSENALPEVDPGAKVKVFYLSKPVFGLVGRASGIWHAGIGFQVEDGPNLLFEFTSLDFMSAVAYPDMKKHGNNGTLHWASASIVDYLIDPDGKVFPEAGPTWKLTEAVGVTTGKGVNMFAQWAFSYATNHPRYLVWRVLEHGTEETLIDSQQCFDFVFRGLQYLQAMGLGTINATELPRTMVNIYATEVELLSFNTSVAEFFSSERKVLEEWAELTGELPHPFEGHSSTWYWPAWFSTTPYLGGNSQLLQDAEYPQAYHKYMLAWPKISKSQSTAPGVQRTDMPVF